MSINPFVSIFRGATLPVLCCGILLAACSTHLPPSDIDGRHLSAAQVTPDAETDIPAIVTPAPLPPVPSPAAAPERYTVVAQEVPLRELLFSMARDASINVDVHPGVSGVISINAIDQSLPQILERIARQAPIRWQFDGNGNLLVEPDSPYWQAYRIDYVNVTRTAETEAQVSTAIVNSVATQGGGAAGGSSAGGNRSNSSISQSTSNNFWATLGANLSTLIQGNADDPASSIVVNPESGVVSVRATARQHEQVATFINSVQTRSLYQVLIEATVVEVTLNDRYQQGVDWKLLDRDGGTLNLEQSLTGANLSDAPTSILTIDRSNTPDAITATISLLSQFGETRVLSSPKIMALNNQAAMLRVVDNKVFFTIDVQAGTPATALTPGTPTVYNSVVHTVPVGLVLAITPQIGDGDQVTLNVRPTISRIVRFVNDPNPIFAENDVINAIPEIQVREIESILKVFSGQVAVLGGLMQDSLSNDVAGLPVLSRLPGVRNLFSYRDERAEKTELIVFIRPVVVREASVNGDLRDYRQYLPDSDLQDDSAAVLPLSTLLGQ